LAVSEFENEINREAVILDVRTPDEFEKGFVPDSVNIGLNGQYAPWVGALLDANVPLVLVTDPGKETEAVLRLARVGYENVSGFLNGGIEAWKAAGKQIDTVQSISANDFAERLNSRPEMNILDVRKPGEVETGIIEGAQHICLSKLQNELNSLDKSQHYYIHCAGGYRSMMAASIMKKKGFEKVTNILGGMSKIKDTGIKLVSHASAL
jgi:rhodanese-related sulfurtransferase